MDSQCSPLDATEVHFVIDSITAACVAKSSDVSMQTWLLNQQVQELLLNGVSVENASLDGLISKELLQRLADAAKPSLGRMAEGFSAAIMSLKNNARESDATLGDLDDINIQQILRETGTCAEQLDVGTPLRRHKARRRGRNADRSLSCEECSKTFTRTDHLTRHKLTHSGAKPFECESCHKSFGRKDKLRVHLLVHSAERPYACAECGYRYATVVSLDQHRRIHRAA